MDWIPTLGDHVGPAYQRIVAALAADISGGRLRRGQQLPTHRALAKALGLDLTTVTRAYAEARRRGLTEARVGQGTFVAETLAQPRGPDAAPPAFDLSMNLPPQPVEADLEGRIVRGIAAIQRERGFSASLNYRDAGGSAEERATAATWLRPRVAAAGADRLVICPGTQNALFCTLMATTRHGDVVYCDPVTYPGLLSAATYLDLRLHAVPGDGEGMLPDALERACGQKRPAAVYLIPTIHNPTAITMPPARRAALAQVIRLHDALLIEDDAYGLLAPDCAPIANLIPERSYVATSLSKCIAPGLRVSFLAAPDAEGAAKVADALRATVQMPTALTVALAARWLADGSADQVIHAIRGEAAARQRLAAQALAGLDYQAHPQGHHVWVGLPRSWSRPEFVAHVQRQGLVVVSSDAFCVPDQAPPHAIRVALGAAASRAELAGALSVLALALRSSPGAARVV